MRARKRTRVRAHTRPKDRVERPSEHGRTFAGARSKKPFSALERQLHPRYGIIGGVKISLTSLALALSAAIAALPCLPSCAARHVSLIRPDEWQMIRQIAVNYGLSEDDTWLLAAIRRYENGRPGLEFGVGGPMDSGHRAHRHRDGVKSFYVQGYWAAGTIRKHYTGDVAAFARRYNPSNATKWAASVKKLMKRLKAENGWRLPGKTPPKRSISLR